MIKHFIFDIFHFDGKFFDTLKNLLFRPGVITKEYNEGKRTKYLDPVRMYLFTSAIFFIIVPFMNQVDLNFSASFMNKSQRIELLYDLSQQHANNPNDTIINREILLLKDSALIIFLDSSSKNTTSKYPVMYRGVQYKLLYDSSKKFMVGEVKPGDNWLTRHLKMKLSAIEVKYSSNPTEGINQFMQIFLHMLPYVLFISLPFFAGILMLLYSRRKNYYFSDHAIFSLHHYIVSFILMMVITIVGLIKTRTGWDFVGYILMALGLTWAIYLYLGMKRFYGQGVFKTFYKFVLLNLMAFIVVSLLFTIFLIFSIFQL